MGYILNGLICYFKKSNTHTLNQSKSSAKCPVFTENALRYRIIVVYVIYIATVSNTVEISLLHSVYLNNDWLSLTTQTVLTLR